MKRNIKRSAIKRKSEILDTASDLFQTKGYEQTTMQDVMDALDIAKGTIYHYFDSKEALFEAVIKNIVDANIAQMKSLLDQTHGTALEKIQILAAAGDMTANNENVLDHLNRPGNDIIHIRLLAATLVKQAPLYAKLIQQGCDEGIFKTNNPLECAEFMLSGVQFLTDLGIYPWTQADLERRALAFPRLIEQMLQAPINSFVFLTQKLK
jgi:AcrR family transcriptional regulator